MSIHPSCSVVRWISERCPCLSSTVKEYQITKFDSNYLNMNGSIHVCWHPNDDAPHFHNTEERIFLGIFNYIDFVFRMIKPNKAFFAAVDGVAPRAKMNQQRGRTFKQVPSHRHDLILCLQSKPRHKRKRHVKKGVVLPTEERFDSNCVSPGTNFMARLQDQLLQFVAVKVFSETLWRGVNVCLSGHESYGSKVRISSGVAENSAVLSQGSMYVPEEITFHLLRLSLLREYLELESQELKITIPFNFKMDNSIDDWVLMCFLVANDFLSHLPNLHIEHNVRLVLYQAYIDVMPSLGGYINEYGKLNSKRFEKFLTRLSQFDYENFADVQAEQKLLGSKRAYAEAPNGIVQQNGSPPSGMEKTKDLDEKRKVQTGTFSHLDIHDFDSDEDQEGFLEMEFHQRKRDYYVNKLENSDVNKQVMQEQAHIWAIQWNLPTTTMACSHGNGSTLHNYSPYISDIKYFQNLYMTFELGKPFLPFPAAQAILPSASKKLVPIA
ncbi:hypothetical protein MRX96_013602 [Rhipicephalus microplus]